MESKQPLTMPSKKRLHSQMEVKTQELDLGNHKKQRTCSTEKEIQPLPYSYSWPYSELKAKTVAYTDLIFGEDWDGDKHHDVWQIHWKLLIEARQWLKDKNGEPLEADLARVVRFFRTGILI